MSVYSIVSLFSPLGSELVVGPNGVDCCSYFSPVGHVLTVT